jgi:hypothetical protein
MSNNRLILSCSVCMDDITNEHKITFTPCIHPFHEECITPWLEEKKYEQQIPCPLCKTDIKFIRL